MDQDLKAENENLRKRLLELEATDVMKLNKNSKKLKMRLFDFTKYKTRHVAITFCYMGWSYSGLVTQLNTDNTVLDMVYKALAKCKLIENKESCNLVVCGRTDKGVSAYQQVISLTVRSNLLSGKGINPDSGANILQRKDPGNQEIDFILLLNRVLPHDIRALKWAPIDADFSARFSCRSRAYKYFFPKSNLSIEKMVEGGRKLIGEHDFRNFCCMQVDKGAINYVRTILDFSIEPFDKSQKDDMFNIYAINIRATAFIYHQIRCIVAIILMIGQETEQPDIIDQLLDIDGVGGDGKPQYQIASDLPLVFFEANYEDIEWQVSEEAVREYEGALQAVWLQHKIKETILKSYLDGIGSNDAEDGLAVDGKSRRSMINAISNEAKSKIARPLMQRLKEPTLTQRIESDAAKKAKETKE